MRQSAIDIVKRWIALDRALLRGELPLARFAARWKVDVKTIRRDLKAFKQLGYEAEKGVYEGMRAGWKYKKSDQEPMFTVNKRFKLKP